MSHLLIMKIVVVIVVLFTTHIVSGGFALACLEKKLSFQQSRFCWDIVSLLRSRLRGALRDIQRTAAKETRRSSCSLNFFNLKSYLLNPHPFFKLAFFIVLLGHSLSTHPTSD